jgi:hypothetical protein
VAFLKIQTTPDLSRRPPTDDQARCSIGTWLSGTGETQLGALETPATAL